MVSNLHQSNKQSLFHQFCATSQDDLSNTPVPVAKELAAALYLVRSKITKGLNGVPYCVEPWFGKEAADIFIKEIEMRGMGIQLEQSTFRISWACKDLSDDEMTSFKDKFKQIVAARITALEKRPKFTVRFDPYASQRHKRGRKSHLAAAINRNIHNNPGMAWVWAIIFVVLFVGSFILSLK